VTIDVTDLGESLVRGPRRSLSEWVALVDEWREAKLSLPAFCQQRGINYKTMSGWLYKRARRRAIEEAKTTQARSRVPQAKPSVKSKEFVPVRLVESQASELSAGNHHQPIEIILVCGRRIAVSKGFDDVTLQRVITLLESR